MLSYFRNYLDLIILVYAGFTASRSMCYGEDLYKRKSISSHTSYEVDDKQMMDIGHGCFIRKSDVSNGRLDAMVFGI